MKNFSLCIKEEKKVYKIVYRKAKARGGKFYFIYLFSFPFFFFFRFHLVACRGLSSLNSD